MAVPFWGGDGWRYEGYEELELPKDLAAKLSQETPLFLYHCRDDDIVPYEHLALYKRLLPHAVMHPLDKGGHQFNNDLAPVAQDILMAADRPVL
jgi:pimeloyl-ACP methyl ester carboxylesterase